MNILWINKITDAECWRTTQLGLTAALRKKGHNVTLVLTKNVGEKKHSKEDITYIPTIHSPILSGLFFGLIVSFYFPLFIRKNKPDIILIDGTSVWLPFVMTLKLFKIPIVMDIRTLPIKKTRSYLFDSCIHSSKIIADALTTITPDLVAIIRKEYDFNSKKIGIWPSGVSLDDFTIKNNGNNGKKQHDSKFIVMHHGSFGYDRGMDDLIQSIAELDEPLREKTKLSIVGINKEKQKEFQRLSKKIGVEKQVEILPRVEYKKIPYLIQKSDVGIIPLSPDKEYWRVSVPLKTLEYMAMGKAIIATNIPFHQSVFEKGKCGTLIKSKTPKSISKAITKLYQNKDKLEEMGKTAREIVKKNYTWDCIAADLEIFFKEIIEDYKK